MSPRRIDMNSRVDISESCLTVAGIAERLKVNHEIGRTVHGQARAETALPHTERRDPEYPMTVREAARFLGVSPQTVYLWVERKQIPHLRVMGRNIRFLKSDLEPFRTSFKQEVENGKTA